MESPRFSKDVLAKMRLSQLRELARRLGVGRYSSMLRLDLLTALQGKGPRQQATASSTLAVPPVETADHPSFEERSWVSAPSPVVQQVAVAAEAVHEGSVVAAPVGVAVAAEAPVDAVTTERAVIAETMESVVEAPTWVWFQPLDSQWALVRWGINGADREQARAAGGQQLVLRMTDVTNRPAHDGRPHTLQEVLVESHNNEWHIPVPLGDRDYRVELGYRTSTAGWISLAYSSVARMPAELDLSGTPFVPFSIVESQDLPVSWEAPLATTGQHERLYQQASTGVQRSRLGSESFHEQGAALHGAAGGHLSGAGLWASGRDASGAGLAPRQRSFWLVADAELIVYGATDPAATLTVGAEKHSLTSEGTFSLHMAFPDGDQTYPIQAVAADGEQKRSITLDFRRTTPHAHVNSRETAVAEWF